MITRVSTKGQVVLPNSIRKRLHIRPGDELEVELEGGRVIMTPASVRRGSVEIVRDPITGLPVLTVGADMPTLTSDIVADILSEAP
ncbi:AbrB/MazE/SpoVT family DNA-binding domain-containing protein [Fimbriimonas ginsengisoli]|uniref:AbrB family transcriptional regulator n=1 Tax=Fimbriimonas ginsengisoli Gsoil 348 TaxID=661478 RepID=A0A068NTL5_FIMGI|nr:AbrB/MazE/SpoVT family DNA-binding domain-containing protein [Fimbriimonas ginsengisoli]AIE86893.1 AbrB family transcriptional regulator [Fimbriimonas ginsengisoli Gsoil 348]